MFSLIRTPLFGQLASFVPAYSRNRSYETLKNVSGMFLGNYDSDDDNEDYDADEDLRMMYDDEDYDEMHENY